MVNHVSGRIKPECRLNNMLMLHYITLHCIALYYIALYYIVLNWIALLWIFFYWVTQFCNSHSIYNYSTCNGLTCIWLAVLFALFYSLYSTCSILLVKQSKGRYYDDLNSVNNFFFLLTIHKSVYILCKYYNANKSK